MSFLKIWAVSTKQKWLSDEKGKVNSACVGILMLQHKYRDRISPEANKQLTEAWEKTCKAHEEIDALIDAEIAELEEML